MEILRMYPKTKKESAALKAVAKAMGISFEVEERSPYNPEFVARVLEGVEAKNRGERGIAIDVEHLWG